jgi:hypothetical protein
MKPPSRFSVRGNHWQHAQTKVPKDEMKLEMKSHRTAISGSANWRRARWEAVGGESSRQDRRQDCGKEVA